MEKNGQENYTSQPGRHEHPGRDGNAVEKCVNYQTENRGDPGVLRSHFMMMRFFPEVKMRRHGVLEEMDEQVSAEHKKENFIGSGRELERFGNHFQECGGEHKACAERDEIVQICARPLPANDGQ